MMDGREREMIKAVLTHAKSPDTPLARDDRVLPSGLSVGIRLGVSG